MNRTPAQHIAQLNIGQLWAPLDDPRSAEFAENSDRINAIAERSAGFIWRCVNEAETIAAEGIALYDGDPCALHTMSVWNSPQDLANFVHKTVHGAFLKRRETWFKPQDHKTYVIWPVMAGHIPTFAEGLARLADLSANGPTEAAYDFKYLRQMTEAEAPT